MLPSPRRLSLALAVATATAACTTGFAQGAAGAKSSPFLPPAAAGAVAAAPGESLEFAGVSSVGKRTDLIFHDKNAKKSHWVGIGETKEGISVLNYDERLQQAVIKWNGEQKILALRKASAKPAGAMGPQMPAPSQMLPPPATPAASGLVMGPAVPTAAPAVVEPAPVPTAKPPAPPTPETQLRQETEARMLVSDLLEIGMAQRKAYEEAQRRAAQANPAPATPPPKD